MIHLQGVRVQYGARFVLDRVDLQIGDRERLAVVEAVLAQHQRAHKSQTLSSGMVVSPLPKALDLEPQGSADQKLVTPNAIRAGILPCTRPYWQDDSVSPAASMPARSLRAAAEAEGEAEGEG